MDRGSPLSSVSHRSTVEAYLSESVSQPKSNKVLIGLVMGISNISLEGLHNLSSRSSGQP